MSGLIDIMRAKSEGDKPLLKDHIAETLRRVLQLKEFMEKNNLKINQSEKFFESLIIAAFIHDLGKISYKYQKKFYQNEIPEELVNFTEKTEKIDLRHEILSAIWCAILLEGNDEWSKKIRTAVLLHHYNDFYINEKDLDEILQNYPEIEKYFDFIYEKWEEIESFLESLRESMTKNFDKYHLIKEALEKISTSRDRVVELKKRINEGVDISEFAEFYEINNENPDYEFLVFLGALRRCDYSASGDFNVEIIDATLNDVFSKIDESIEKKRKMWESDWQWELLKEVKDDSLVLVAPTGSGKTEFALLWGKKALGKLIYTVPLRVALNDLYLRFKNYLGEYSNKNLGLLHSTAFVEYVKEERENKGVDVESKVNSSTILANPITLATPDQVFLTSLHYYGSDKVISIYPYSAFVLDEIQSYTPEMAAIIIKTLKIVEELGGKILVMTATLPPYFRPFFEDIEVPELSDKHKRLLKKFKLNAQVCDTSKIKEKVKNYQLMRHKIGIVEDYLTRYKANSKDNKKDYKIEVNKDALFEKLSELRRNGKRSIFIVVNNVSKAIAIYETLSKKLKKKDNGVDQCLIYLLHSRLLENVKESRIKDIKEKLGKEDIIAVATQIIEASVDLDFDAMITEISPIDSQIQRWGRVYRNKNTDYSGGPNIYVFLGEKTEEGEIKFDKGTTAVYIGRETKGAARAVLEKTVEQLKKINGELLNYEKERKLIESVFNSKIGEKNLWTLYLEEVLEILDFLNYFSVEKKSQAQRIFREIAGFQVVIPEAMDHYGKEDWMKKLIDLIREKGKEIPWSELESHLGKSKWEIKDALYQYSINVPHFFIVGRKRVNGSLDEFKGYSILWLDDKSKLKDLWEYGLDKIVEQSEEDLIGLE